MVKESDVVLEQAAVSSADIVMAKVLSVHFLQRIPRLDLDSLLDEVNTLDEVNLY